MKIFKRFSCFDETSTTGRQKTNKRLERLETNLTSPLPSIKLPVPPVPVPLHPSLPRVQALHSPDLKLCLLHLFRRGRGTDVDEDEATAMADTVNQSGSDLTMRINVFSQRNIYGHHIPPILAFVAQAVVVNKPLHHHREWQRDVSFVPIYHRFS